MEFPIYMKAFRKWHIKLINENELLEIKHDWSTELDTRERSKFTYRITSYNNAGLVKQWLTDLDNPDEPDYVETTKSEFVKIYFETIHKLNDILIDEVE